MQNKHEKLHLSVTEIRSFCAILPLASESDVLFVGYAVAGFSSLRFLSV
jgi:hypothetical protein